jgi:hypothetical protein
MADPIPELYGLSASYIARVCHVDLATARRWRRGATCLPYTARVLLTGDLSGFGPQWRGWKMKGGCIVSPEGWAATPGDVMMVQLAQLQLGDYRRENRALKAVVAELEAEVERNQFEEQPLPDQWEIAVG